MKTFSYTITDEVGIHARPAGLLAKKAGCDTEIPVGASYRNLPNYVRSGELDEKLIDESVRRILTIKFNGDYLENPLL